MSNSAIEKVSALVPEVWFDLIARVVPGAVIVLAASSTGSGLELPFGGLAVGLVGVYVVGYTFDVVSEGSFSWIFYLLSKHEPKCFYTYRQLWDKVELLKANQRTVIVKMSAEAVLARSLFFYFFLQLCLLGLSRICDDGKIPWQPLSKITVHSWSVSLFFGLVAIVCWISMHKAMTQRINAMLKYRDSKTKQSD